MTALDPRREYGEYVQHREPQPFKPKHLHWYPGGVYGRDNWGFNTLPKPAIGDVWQCDCGTYYRYGTPWWSSGPVAWDPISEHKALKIAKKAKTS